jgi:hypothetical protein
MPLEKRDGKSFLNRAAGSAAYDVIVTVVITAAGVIASLFADNIKEAHHLLVGTISWPAVAFWVTAILAAILFFFGQAAKDERRKQAEQRLDSRADELANLIRTLPPGDFLSELGGTYSICRRILATTQSGFRDIGPVGVKKSIREVLQSIASLARKFDAESPRSHYAANIMRFRAAASIAATDENDTRARLRFCEPEVALGSLEGILDLDRELSARLEGTVGDAPAPDDQLQPLALPVPRNAMSGDGKRWRVLPGAPLCFVKTIVARTPVLDAYADTRTLGAWCRKQQEFSESIAQQVEKYFSGPAGERVASFVCFPLVRLEDDGVPVAVLNVHANRPAILRQNQSTKTDSRQSTEPAERFRVLIGPLLTILVDLLNLLDSLEEDDDGKSSGKTEPRVEPVV